MGSTAKGFAIGFGIFGGLAILIGLPFVLHRFFDYRTARNMSRALRLLVAVAGYLIYRHLTGKAE